MIIVDKTGRKFRLGQYVDVHMQPIITGQVVEIHESNIMLPGNQQVPPHVVIALLPVNPSITRMRAQDVGEIDKVYIIADAPPDFEKTLAEAKKSGHGLVSLDE